MPGIVRETQLITTTGGGGGGGATQVADGVNNTLLATVLSLANSKPLTVAIVDNTGAQVAVGGGTQYAEDTASVAGEQLMMAGVVRKDVRGTIATATGNRSELQVNASGDLRVDGSAVTQPISAASLPLPTGASTEATLSSLNGKVTAVNTGAVVVSSSALPTGAATDTTQTANGVLIGPVTETAPATDTASSGLNGRLQRIAQRLTTLISGINVGNIGGTATSVGNGTSNAGVLRVAIVSDQTQLTNKLLVTPDSVALPLHQSVNVDQINGVTPAVNSGVNSTGTQRVTVATDDALNAVLGTTAGAAVITDVSGTIQQYLRGLIKLAITAGGWLTSLVPISSNGLSKFHLVSAATTNATSVKASQGNLYGYYIYNSNAAARKVCLHNTAGTPTAGAAVTDSFVIPPTSAANCSFEQGIQFSTGIGITTVTGLADSDNTVVAANDLIINLYYK